MKWFRNKEMLRNTLEENCKLMEKTCSQKFIWSLKDYNNLVKDHLELLEENEKLKTAINFLSNFLYISKLETLGEKDTYYLVALFHKVEIGSNAYKILKEWLEPSNVMADLLKEVLKDVD